MKRVLILCFVVSSCELAAVQIAIPASARAAMDKLVTVVKAGVQKGVDVAGEKLMQQQVQAQLQTMSVRYGVMAGSAALYGCALWLAGETLRDVCYRYAALKLEYEKTAQHLRTYHVNGQCCLCEPEVKVGAALQALSRVPKEFWREIISTCMVIALYKSAYFVQAKL